MGDPRKGNTTKFLSYKFAHEQMKQAIEGGFFIEATAIQESLISDRLISFLSGTESLTKNKSSRWPMFSELIEIAKKSVLNGKCDLNVEILDELDGWRKKRNVLIHRIAQSDPGEPTIPIEEFRKDGQAAAIQGKGLARKILACA